MMGPRDEGQQMGKVAGVRHRPRQLGTAAAKRVPDRRKPYAEDAHAEAGPVIERTEVPAC